MGSDPRGLTPGVRPRGGAGPSPAPNRVCEQDAAVLEAENYKGVTYKLLEELGQKEIQTPLAPRSQDREAGGHGAALHLPVQHRDGKFKFYGTDDWEDYPAEVAK